MKPSGSFPWCGFFLVAALSVMARPDGFEAAPGSGARLLPIAGDGFAGSSVNVVSGVQNTLFTDRGFQFAGFYAADGTVVLARRKLGDDAWEASRTALRGRVDDAHDNIAIAVDGDGFLHIAWDHHANALNYCRSVAPGSLELGPKQPMTGQFESSVTYPQFLRLPDGDLLFFYRDGRSGRGNLVLNRYATRAHTWSQVQANVIDGENLRSAYTTMTVDRRGVLHLGWNWRDSADVASNHDLCYARSADGGVTWTTTSGAPLKVPLTAANAEYALRIPTGSTLMNPPSIAVDDAGQPCLANYWCPEGSNVPQYHLVRFDGHAWKVTQITHRTTPFTLAGTATKRPPISRAVLLPSKEWRKPQQMHLAYRDDEQGGRIVLASCLDLAKGEWNSRELTTSSVGAWEPSLDPVQSQRFAQLHMLVQNVEQRDGNDSKALTIPGTTVASMIWSPLTAAMTRPSSVATPLPVAGVLDRPLVAADVLSLLQRAADWQLAQSYPKDRDARGWEIAPFYLGVLALAEISPDEKYRATMLAKFEALKWEPAPRVYHADDYAVVQAYLALHRQRPEPHMLAPARARFDAILAKPAITSLEWAQRGATDRWSWCDALFMGPASWLMLAQATGDARYTEFANREWWATVDKLYSPADRLFARDESFLDLREPNGRRLFWARGNGWVLAGLANVLAALPADHPDRLRYVGLFRNLSDAALAAQQADGLWRPGLLDPVAHDVRETSGSGFIAFALAAGVNRGLLDRVRFEPAVRHAWHALTACVTAEGKLEHVQPVGAGPEEFDPKHNDWFATGALLLAGRQVYQFADGSSPVLPR